MAFTRRLNIKIILFQRDYFTRRRRVFSNINLVRRNNLNYLPVNAVLEILEYDIKNRTRNNFTVTDGSEFVTIPKKGPVARREGIHFPIDTIIHVNNRQFISLRSVNRLFDVDLIVNIRNKTVFIRQPGRFFVTLKGDDLRSIAALLNTSVKRLLSVNKNLREPISSGIRVTIPTTPFRTGMQKMNRSKPKKGKITFHVEAGPIINLGKTLKGTRYKFGAGPYRKTGVFDCSSYMQYIYGRNGEALPRTSRAQARIGIFRRQRDIEPGDLIFFRRNRYSDNRIGHVGMDIGNGRMLNTYKSPPGVTITRWRSPYWLGKYVTAREVL
ncbi:C40 family peptidase [Brevibacillus choshinensis]|uniref:C40 family peptidase n=1 Tax=Brevibacillus choshinensis TaxID=54911 RepID=A0ABX7FIR9_BRECH|nr:C40 family peptidase [Brevibacillus choshinensis]QRG65577.1 C40 family peptidase [Brevibacillus choshinensis]